MEHEAFTQINKRLDNIDETMRQVHQVLVQVARTEEKVAGLLQKTLEHDLLFKDLNTKMLEGERRFAEIEKHNATQHLTITIVKKVLAFAAVVSLMYIIAHPDKIMSILKLATGI